MQKIKLRREDILIKDYILNKILNFLSKRGYYVSRPHYLNPIPDKKYLSSINGYWKYPYPCHGIEFHDEEQLLLCEQLSKFACEINELPEDILNPQKNTSFLDLDLEFLYCMIRLLKPKSFIEIGAGWSSRIALQAMLRNRKEGHNCKHTIIEPYRGECFPELFKEAQNEIKKPVQEVPVNIFDRLSLNDILFIDTSHISKYGSDVNYLYFHIIPRVGAGCYIHIHDIFIPNEYHEEWVFTKNLFFDEQYLVTAFLMYNSEFRIRIAAQYLSQKYRDRINRFFPRFKPSFSPGSLWIQRR